MLEKIKNRGKIGRTLDWLRKEQNMQIVYYLLKSRVNSLTFQKKLGSGSERPHDSCLQHTAAVERHSLARKGLRQNSTLEH